MKKKKRMKVDFFTRHSVSAPKRSSFLIYTIIGAIAAGIGFFNFYTKKPSIESGQEVLVQKLAPLDSLTYNEFYRRTEGLPQTIFAHADFPSAQDIATENKDSIERRFLEKSPPDIVVSDRKYQTRRIFAGVDLSQEFFSEYTKRSNESIREFFAFAGIEERIPKVEYHPIDSIHSLRSSDTNVLRLNIGWTSTNEYIGRFKIDKKNMNVSPNKKMDLFAEISNQIPVPYGEATLHFDGVYEKDGFVLKGTTIDPFLLMIGNGAVSAYTSPPAEAMHYALADIRAARSITEINSDWEKQGRPVVMTSELLNRATTKWLYREEAVVHALLDTFITKKESELGFQKGELTKYLSHEGIELYSLIPIVKDKINRLGANAAMNLYLTDPEALFSKQ